ncbi:MAG: TolC family protein [Nostoc sp. ChiSLP02]|nr:TolC family protein [Nostoc sp. DedSLP05]MDZ8097457.1 TolC family protein [Nostoc sp. DedSLP01]MDZ8187045.1 TolC family protein [Nostoc sp. ChiSLP02]
MKGQQLFHSFLPGVTAAVLTTQPAWADTVKVSGVQLASSSSALTSTYSQTLVVDFMNTQLPKTANVSIPTLLPAPGFTKFNVKPLSNNSIPVFMAENTDVPIKQVAQKDKGRLLGLTATSGSSQQPDINRSLKSNQKQSNSSPYWQKLKKTVVPDYTSKSASAEKEILSVSSQQPVVQKINTVSQLQTLLQTSSKDVRAAKLLSVNNCQQQELGKSTINSSAALLLASNTCLKQNALDKRLAQSNTTVPTESTPSPSLPGSLTPAPGGSAPNPTVPGSLTPAPGSSTPTPTVPTSVTPVPSGPVQIPENLIPNANPLQFPTKPGEVTFQGNQPITLAQALELARRNNRDLQVSLLELERSRYALREAEATLLPTLGVNADITRGQSSSSQLGAEQQERQTGLPSNGDEASTRFSGQAQLSYDLYTSGLNKARRNAAREQVRFNELAVEAQSEEIRLNVTTDYYNLQQADEQVRIAQSAVQNSEASLRDAEALERAGVGTRFDVLRSQVNLANAQQDLTNARSQQAIARRQLATRISLPQGVNISAADPVQLAGLWDLTLEESIVRAFQNRPELQQQLAQRNINEQQRRQALAELGPQVSLVATYDLLDQFDDSVSVTDGYSFGVRATLNLFDGGAARARAAQQRTNIAIAETQFAQQRDQIRFQVEQAFSNQQSNLENVQTANTALEQAREALRLARLRFQAGVGTQTDVINSENDLTRAEGNRVAAILDYNRALAQLQRSVTLRGLR